MTFTPTFQRPGQINGAGSADANFLVTYTGEVLSAYLKENEFRDWHKRRTVKGNIGNQFMVTGSLAPAGKFLVPGNATTQTTLKVDQREINPDGMLYESIIVHKWDDVKSHFEIRNDYANQLGSAIAQYDNNIIAQSMLLSAREAGRAGEPGGSQIVSATSKTDSDALVASIFAAREELDEKRITEEVKCFLHSSLYNLLVRGERLINKDLNGSNGGLDTGTIGQVASVGIVKAVNMPRTNITGTYEAKYDVDATNTTAIITTSNSVGSAVYQEAMVETDYKVEYKGLYTDISMIVGYGTLRPEGSVEIITA